MIELDVSWELVSQMSLVMVAILGILLVVLLVLRKKNRSQGVAVNRRRMRMAGLEDEEEEEESREVFRGFPLPRFDEYDEKEDYEGDEDERGEKRSGKGGSTTVEDLLATLIKEEMRKGNIALVPQVTLTTGGEMTFLGRPWKGEVKLVIKEKEKEVPRRESIEELEKEGLEREMSEEEELEEAEAEEEEEEGEGEENGT